MGRSFEYLSNINVHCEEWLQRVNSQTLGTTHEIPYERLKNEPLNPMDSVQAYSIRLEDIGKISSKSTSSIIDFFGLEGIDVLKSDCKGCESQFTKKDFYRINRGIEIECADGNMRRIFELAKNEGFQIHLRHYDGTCNDSLQHSGMIVGLKKRIKNY